MRVHLNSRIKPEAERLRKHETFDVGFTGCLRSGGAAETRENRRSYASPPLPTHDSAAITNLRGSVHPPMDFAPLPLPPSPPLSPSSKSNYRCANSWSGTVITRIISRPLAIFHGRVSGKILTTHELVRIIKVNWRKLLFFGLYIYIFVEI